jgi:hypothetical protein
MSNNRLFRRTIRILQLPSILVLLMGTLACGSTAKAFAPSTVLSIAGGSVHVLRTGTQDWSIGRESMVLQTGDKIKTDPGALATITFFDGSIIDLNGDTEIALDKLSDKTASSAKIIQITQEIGDTTSRVVKLVDPASRYEINTPSAVAAVRGSTMVVQVTPDKVTRVYNVEGSISITAQGQEVLIPVGSSSYATPGEPPSFPVSGIRPDIRLSNINSISARTGWQQTGLQLNVGDKFFVEYRGGSWTIDYKNFADVGPSGYSTDIEKTIGAGYKLDSSVPYGYLLGKVGNGKEIPIGHRGASFTAEASGFLFLRINDIDSALGDNDGAITVALRGLATKPTTTKVNSGSNSIALNVPATGSGGFNYTQGTYLEGFEFRANSAISVTQLGAYDSNYSHLPHGAETFSPVEVALYNLTTHTQLGSVTVRASDPLIGVFHYASLVTPISLNTKDNYAVVWVSGTNYYLVTPTLTLMDVNPAITYVGFVGYGAGGLTQTTKMVEPDWFYRELDHGINALNYDIGPNFKFAMK